LENWRRELLERLIDLVHAERAPEAADSVTWPPVPIVEGAAGRVALRVYLFSGQSPGTLLQGPFSASKEPGSESFMDSRLKNTVLAWIDR
jgi:hypothetical protein